MDAVMRPLIKFNEWRGAAVRLMGRVATGQHARLRKKNPFRGYAPGPQDVFVMTYAKSGTNWMMQIVHQLIWHGQGEYEHLHDVVPWPDTLAMPFVKKYSGPNRNAGVFQPMRTRVHHDNSLNASCARGDDDGNP